MAKTSILIVEDEGIVAKNVQIRLKKLGYSVPAVAYSGREAIKKAVSTNPNLVLMDIVLKGDMDGVEAARQIKARNDIRIVYLTAYADNKTIGRAKITEPFGHVVKPFEIKELHSAIQVALYKHETEKKLKEKKKPLVKTLKNIGYAVITIDDRGLVVYMNPPAEELIGIRQGEAFGKDLSKVMSILKGDKTNLSGKLLGQVKRNGSGLSFKNHKLISKNNGSGISVDIRAIPNRDEEGVIDGVVLVIDKDNGRIMAENGVSEYYEPELTSEEKSNISLGVITSSNLVSEGIKKLIEPEKDIKLAAEASTHSEIIPLIGQVKPDVLIIDTALPNLDLEKIQKSIEGMSARTKVLLLLHSLDEMIVINALSLGVKGFITNNTKTENLSQAIRFVSVSKGEVWGDIIIMKKILEHVSLTQKSKPVLSNTNLTKKIRLTHFHGGAIFKIQTGGLKSSATQFIP